ncbi:MAG: ATP-binding protein [Kibdelosporangium sp.]
MTTDHLLKLSVRGEADVFLLRQRGREVTQAIGLDTQDQTRVATSLSDLGRDVLDGVVWVSVEFALAVGSRPALRIQLRWQGGRDIPEQKVGWVSASRLMSEVNGRRSGDERVITLLKNLPASLKEPDRAEVALLRVRLARLTRASALDEMRAQNEELVLTLESLERKQNDLVRLNAELEETNQGVVALYNELSGELEETNRGVVALYAELDDKSNQLKEAIEAKTRFWANVSHELRTPINSVIGLSRLLLDRHADPLTAEQHHQAKMISDSGETLLVLVNELLDAAKAESGRLRPQLGTVDLRALFAQLRGTLRPIVPNGDVALVVEDPDVDSQLVTDETMLIRILRNLLSNGLKFTQQGEVSLTAHRDEAGQWEFRVTDTGIGIPIDEQKRVFEEFHQVPNPLQERTSGTGLGLPYARRLAEILGGNLRLSSTPGEGTEVVFVLPVHDKPDHLGRVLLIDDDEVFRATFHRMIAGVANDIREAGDGRTGLRVAAADPPDLIFLDLNMPQLSGYDCLAALRTDPVLTHIPVIVVTSADSEGIDHSALGPGVALLHKSRLSVEAVLDGLRQARTRGGS